MLFNLIKFNKSKKNTYIIKKNIIIFVDKQKFLYLNKKI